MKTLLIIAGDRHIDADYPNRIQRDVVAHIRLRRHGFVNEAPLVGWITPSQLDGMTAWPSSWGCLIVHCSADANAILRLSEKATTLGTQTVVASSDPVVRLYRYAAPLNTLFGRIYVLEQQENEDVLV